MIQQTVARITCSASTGWGKAMICPRFAFWLRHLNWSLLGHHYEYLVKF